ncbi:hypothetical protein [Nonomuraea insulae]|uniref:Cell division protein FtsL n=1 Tax=Nonomuraea insulae TaxID=1616787 RepID=A0ABW1CYS0_9ACTN
MTTEQETGRGKPVRRAVPKTGTRRSALSQQPKPRPRPDTRAEAEGKPSAAERERAAGLAGKRPVDSREGDKAPRGAKARREGKASVGERVRPEGKASVGERVRSEGKTSVGERVRPEGKTSVGERVRPEGKAAAGERARPEGSVRERVRPEGKAPAVERPGVAAKRPVRGSSRAAASRPAARRHPTRRQRAPFVLLVVGLLCGGLVSLLLLNTMLAQDAITDATLRDEIAVAKRENEKIDQEYQRKTQPGPLAEQAEKQGYGTDWDNINLYNGATDQAGQADTER